MTSFPPNRYVQITRTILTNIRLDVRLVFLVTSFPPNRYVQITRTIITNLRLDVRLDFLVTSFPPNRYDPITRTLLTKLTFRVKFVHFSRLTPSPPTRHSTHIHFLLPRTILGHFTIQVTVT